VSPRWFTDEYLAILENSLSAWDYAPANLAFLETKGIRYPHTFLVPIGGVAAYSQLLQDCGEPALPEVEPGCDVLFYGDVNAPRRQEMLQALQRQFSVRIEGNLFGDALRQAVRQARVVVNIHYYEGALLETTRVYECLSLGTPVVTESSADIHQHAALLDNPALRVTPVGDAQAMVQAVQEMLQLQAQAPEQVQRGLVDELARSGQQFEFMVLRALYALGRIDTAQWEALTSSQPLPGRCMVLSMPETVRRRAHFIEQTLPGLQTEVKVFDGVRYSPGWLGCAMSRMTSMVHNIYAQPALEALAQWDSSMRDPHTNTIDSYLQGRAQMRVVTTLPFLVAHTTDMDSSLWGINNHEYLAVIYKAEQDLRQLVDRFKQAQGR